MDKGNASRITSSRSLKNATFLLVGWRLSHPKELPGYLPVPLECHTLTMNKIVLQLSDAGISILQCSAQFRILIINAHFVVDNAYHALASSATAKPTLNVEEEVVVIRNGWTPKKKKTHTGCSVCMPVVLHAYLMCCTYTMLFCIHTGCAACIPVVLYAYPLCCMHTGCAVCMPAVQCAYRLYCMHTCCAVHMPCCSVCVPVVLYGYRLCCMYTCCAVCIPVVLYAYLLCCMQTGCAVCIPVVLHVYLLCMHIAMRTPYR